MPREVGLCTGRCPKTLARPAQLKHRPFGAEIESLSRSVRERWLPPQCPWLAAAAVPSELGLWGGVLGLPRRLSLEELLLVLAPAPAPTADQGGQQAGRCRWNGLAGRRAARRGGPFRRAPHHGVRLARLVVGGVRVRTVVQQVLAHLPRTQRRAGGGGAESSGHCGNAPRRQRRRRRRRARTSGMLWLAATCSAVSPSGPKRESSGSSRTTAGNETRWAGPARKQPRSRSGNKRGHINVAATASRGGGGGGLSVCVC